MPRARNVKPSFFKNEDLVELPFETRLLFIGLWTLADREGRLEDRPKRIKMELFPADDVSIDACLDQLQKFGFIRRYAVGSSRFILVTNFARHQNPHQKEAASVIPAPDSVPIDVAAPEEHGASTVRAPDEHQTSPADSLNLVTDSPNLVTDSLEREAAQARPRTRSRKAAKSKEPTLTPEQLEQFERWYTHYPRKENRAQAEKAWAEIEPAPDDALVDRMITTTKRYAASSQWEEDGGQFVPHPPTWLKNARWNDEPPKATTRGRLTQTHANDSDTDYTGGRSGANVFKTRND